MYARTKVRLRKKTENKLFTSHTSIHLIVQLAIKSTTYGDVIEAL